jgi:hypothetical protein
VRALGLDNTDRTLAGCQAGAKNAKRALPPDRGDSLAHSKAQCRTTCILSIVLSWLAWLGIALLITAVAAITGIKPKGTRHVAHTRLMGVARLALLALVIILAYFAFRARSGG